MTGSAWTGAFATSSGDRHPTRFPNETRASRRGARRCHLHRYIDVRRLSGVALAALFAKFRRRPCRGRRPDRDRFSPCGLRRHARGQGGRCCSRSLPRRLPGKVKDRGLPQLDAVRRPPTIDPARQQGADAGHLAVKFEPYTKQLQVFDLPFLFDDLEALEAFQSAIRAANCCAPLAQHGIYGGLAYWNNGMKQLSATRELHRPTMPRAWSSVSSRRRCWKRGSPCSAPPPSSCPTPETLRPYGQRAGHREHLVEPRRTEKIDSVQPHHRDQSRRAQLHADHQFGVRTGIPYQTRTELESIVDEVTWW